MRRVGTVGKFTAALLVFAFGLYAAPKAAAAFRNVQAGTEAPAFKLADLSGNEVSLDSFRGDNAVLVVFWATWSARSLDELRDVQKLVASYGPKGLKAVAVNVEHEHATDDDLRMIREKAASLNLTYPVLLDKGLDTFRNYGVVAVPSTGVLARGNVLREAFNGYPSFVFLDLKARVEELLGLRPKEAAVAAKADTSHKPTRPALLNYNLGRRLFAFGMPDKAEPKLRSAAAADPKWAAPNVLLGEVLLSRSGKDPGKVAEAKKAFEAAVASEEGNVVARTGLARVYWLSGQAADAEREVDAALKKSATYPPALLLKASILARKGDVPGAEKLVREAIELNPRDPATHALAGRAYEEAKDLVKAAAMYRKAWELNGEH
ncbi:MAG: redoxin domain-containing protein [Desulfobacteria bacterium]